MRRKFQERLGRQLWPTYKIALMAFALLGGISAQAQQRAWVYLKNKATEGRSPAVSANTLKNRALLGLPVFQETDYHVENRWLDSLRGFPAELHFASKWLNAVALSADLNTLQNIAKKAYVKAVVPMRGDFYPTYANEQVQAKPINAATKAMNEGEWTYHTAQKQMNTALFRQEGIVAEGITIGLIDAGFRDAHKAPQLRHIFNRNRLLGARDYVNPRADFFGQQPKGMDTHGTTVMKYVAGVDSLMKMYTGAASEATFYIARTDDAETEYRIEEDWWLRAMEWMDSAGVRLINSSLGYSVRHTDPKEDYKLSDMDGKTTAVAKAANIATEKKGIMVVISAGNEGNDQDWGIISSPADAQGVLTIGATDYPQALRMGYSGVGTSSLKYVKPDLACFSYTGTSFSAPAITGFVACMMQKNPKLTNKELVQLIHRSSSLYPFPNNFLGYGVPDAGKALQLLNDPEALKSAPKKTYITPNRGEKMVSFDPPLDEAIASTVVVFHKSDERMVLKQELVKLTKGKWQVEKFSNKTKFTTVCLPTGVVEIRW